MTAWREIRALRDPERFEPWLHRILTNACYAEARRRTRLVGADPAPSRRARARARRVPDRRTTATSSNGPSGGSPSNSAPCWCSTTTSGFRCPRWPIASAFPSGPSKSRMHHATRALRASLEADARTTATSQERTGMTAPHDLDRQLVHDFLTEGQTELADQVVRRGPRSHRSRNDNGSSSARGGLPDHEQARPHRPRRRRRGRGPRRRYPAPPPARVRVASAAVPSVHAVGHASADAVADARRRAPTPTPCPDGRPAAGHVTSCRRCRPVTR